MHPYLAVPAYRTYTLQSLHTEPTPCSPCVQNLYLAVPAYRTHTLQSLSAELDVQILLSIEHHTRNQPVYFEHSNLSLAKEREHKHNYTKQKLFQHTFTSIDSTTHKVQTQREGHIYVDSTTHRYTHNPRSP